MFNILKNQGYHLEDNFVISAILGEFCKRRIYKEIREKL